MSLYFETGRIFELIISFVSLLFACMPVSFKILAKSGNNLYGPLHGFMMPPVEYA